MSYTVRNFKTKKQLKTALQGGEEIRVFNPGLGPDLAEFTGTVYLEGPHYPAPHTWCARATVVNGLITRVK